MLSIQSDTVHYWEVLKIIVSIKTFLVNEQWRVVDSIKHCETRLPLKWCSFSEKHDFHSKQDFRREAFYNASESTQLCVTWVFFLGSFSRNFDDQVFTDLLFDAYVGIHQVRTLYFVNLLYTYISRIWNFTFNDFGWFWKEPFVWNQRFFSETYCYLSYIR